MRTGLRLVLVRLFPGVFTMLVHPSHGTIEEVERPAGSLIESLTDVLNIVEDVTAKARKPVAYWHDEVL